MALTPAVDPRIGPLTIQPIGDSVLLLWTRVPGADRYVVKTKDGTTTLGPGATSHFISLVGAASLLSLINATVEPQVIFVSAMAGNRVLRTFIGKTICPKTVFIAARGSGQNNLAGAAFGRGLGDRGLRVWQGIRRAVDATAVGLPAVAIDYPAVKVGLTMTSGLPAPEVGNLPERYSSSVDLGVIRTQTTILKTLIACPRARIILFGYSQGAQVVGNAFSQLAPNVRRSIARVILFADPLYRPNDNRVTYLPTRLQHSGIKGSRSTFPTGDKAVIESWCWESDVICQGPPRTSFHGDIYDKYEVLAAQRAAAP